MGTLKKSAVGVQSRRMSGNLAFAQLLIVSNPLLPSFLVKPPACASTSDSGYYELLNRGPTNSSYKVLIKCGTENVAADMRKLGFALQ